MDDLDFDGLLAADSLDDADVPPVVPALEVRDVVLDPTFGKRRDALLRSVPVHDLVDRAGRSGSGLEAFDVRALVLAAFDAVIARQGFPERTMPDQVVDLLSGIAAVQSPAAGAQACRAAAAHVLDGLTNRRMRERQFSLPSMVYAEGPNGEVAAASVPRSFWLLREAEDPHTGVVYLEASADAINALVSGLDIPIEDQQTALETVLERQLHRGELDAAHMTALQARRLSAAYLVQIEELLAETERYLPGTDWAAAAPRLINDALDHLNECLTRETRLLDHVAGGITENAAGDRGTPATAERRAKISAALTRMLTESRHLHTLLLERLVGARGRFLDAQDDQMFRPLAATVEFDLTDDLLVPALGLHIADAEHVAGLYLAAVMGPVTPVVLNWGDFVEALIHPRRASDEDVREATEEEVEFRDDPTPLVDAALVDRAHRVLDRVPLPARLSTLIAAADPAEGTAAAVGDLFVAAALRGFDNSSRDSDPDPQPGGWVKDDDPAAAGPGTAASPRSPAAAAHLLHVLGPGAACVSDGTPLKGDGWDGDDLIVCMDRDSADAILLGDEPAPEPAVLPDHLRRDPS
ncbi:hypothetical protein JK386_04920 [Nocardioides sp. zg-536]|uniref:Uncharacterized protein n=1 Tax=Nocardioides faecalis TaxID=2803858 RepID=A0A939BXU9_9ACTN|nr:hypothetical protein [Nocardioides faecalis]MBM9459235.1 hypothetical protein [Nocardioides faecalis]QVI59630.1 hypothetical protein KG111_04595 [Nocardioides faecalis]